MIFDELTELKKFLTDETNLSEDKNEPRKNVISWVEKDSHLLGPQGWVLTFKSYKSTKSIDLNLGKTIGERFIKYLSIETIPNQLGDFEPFVGYLDHEINYLVIDGISNISLNPDRIESYLIQRIKETLNDNS